MASVTRCVGLVGPEPIKTLGRVRIGRRKLFGGNTRVVFVATGTTMVEVGIIFFKLVFTVDAILICFFRLKPKYTEPDTQGIVINKIIIIIISIVADCERLHTE